MSDPVLISAYQPSTINSAVQRCVDAFNRSYQDAIANGETEYSAASAAASAFRAAMPELTSAANIRDFIACTARGILLGAIEEKQGSRLLYAAQVASAALRSTKGEEPATAKAKAQSAA